MPPPLRSGSPPAGSDRVLRSQQDWEVWYMVVQVVAGEHWRVFDPDNEAGRDLRPTEPVMPELEEEPVRPAKRQRLEAVREAKAAAATTATTAATAAKEAKAPNDPNYGPNTTTSTPPPPPPMLPPPPPGGTTTATTTAAATTAATTAGGTTAATTTTTHSYADRVRQYKLRYRVYRECRDAERALRLHIMAHVSEPILRTLVPAESAKQWLARLKARYEEGNLLSARAQRAQFEYLRVLRRFDHSSALEWLVDWEGAVSDAERAGVSEIRDGGWLRDLAKTFMPYDYSLASGAEIVCTYKQDQKDPKLAPQWASRFRLEAMAKQMAEVRRSGG